MVSLILLNLFTPRQLLALLTFTIEVHHAYFAMLENGIEPENAQELLRLT